MNRLQIAPGLELDADYVAGGTFALLAKKGAGKTYTGRVLCEEFWKAKVPFVALDPMDAWWGLRSSADGNKEGIPVAIFGGEHGDAPLERTSGKLMADLVVDEGLSMILSLKHFGSRSAERQFALDFLERLYRRNSELVHLLIDEADLFAPQKPQGGDATLLGVTENIVRRGRNSGIGVTLITQRPAVLNKDVLTQVDGLVAMRIVGLTDREAIDAWVKGHADGELAREVKGTLAGLDNGESWWWIPELDILKRVQVRRSRTFDSSPTRKRGAKPREPRSYADVDMSAIEEKISETIERAKAEDPRELRQRIRELEQQLTERPQAEPDHVVERVPIEVPVLSDETAAWLEETLAEARAIAAEIEALPTALQALADQVGEALKRTRNRPVLEQGERREAARTVAPPASRPPTRRPAPAPAEGEPTAYARSLLETLARRHPLALTRGQISTLSGRSPRSSAFGDAMREIIRDGWAWKNGSQFELTQNGLDLVGDLAGTTDDPIETWRNALSGYERGIFDELVAVHPHGLTRAELAERTGRSITSSAFGDAIRTLVRNGLADTGGGEVRASDSLFIGASG